MSDNHEMHAPAEASEGKLPWETPNVVELNIVDINHGTLLNIVEVTHAVPSVTLGPS